MGDTFKGGREWLGQDAVGLPDTHKLVMVNQPDIVVDKHQKKAVMVHMAVWNDYNIWKKEHKSEKN